MGMDVFGRNPSDKCGEYFRASVWSWVPLWEAMYRTSRQELGKELLSAMTYNEGAGPEDQQCCNLVADRIEQLLTERPGGFEVRSTIWTNSGGRLLSDEEVKSIPLEERRSPFVADGEHIRDFIDFLRHCGGFRVC